MRGICDLAEAATGRIAACLKACALLRIDLHVNLEDFRTYRLKCRSQNHCGLCAVVGDRLIQKR